MARLNLLVQYWITLFFSIKVSAVLSESKVNIACVCVSDQRTSPRLTQTQIITFRGGGGHQSVLISLLLPPASTSDSRPLVTGMQAHADPQNPAPAPGLRRREHGRACTSPHRFTDERRKHTDAEISSRSAGSRIAASLRQVLNINVWGQISSRDNPFKIISLSGCW